MYLQFSFKGIGKHASVMQRPGSLCTSEGGFVFFEPALGA